MDLNEVNSQNRVRHPWELARAAALSEIISQVPMSSCPKVLDVGCGDGFAVDAIFGGEIEGEIDAVDHSLTEPIIKKLAIDFPQIRFHNSFDSLQSIGYDWITLLDVLEHVEEDSAFLHDIIHKYATTSTYICITVPAFQQLFCSHDRYLKHYRRYTHKHISEVAIACGLSVVSSGYLFSLLLFPRVMQKLAEGIFPFKEGKHLGVGNWQHGPLLTGFVNKILQLENRLSLILNRAGVRVPGLTAWVLCKTSQ